MSSDDENEQHTIVMQKTIVDNHIRNMKSEINVHSSPSNSQSNKHQQFKNKKKTVEFIAASSDIISANGLSKQASPNGMKPTEDYGMTDIHDLLDHESKKPISEKPTVD